jgi:hypothetical protein
MNGEEVYQGLKNHYETTGRMMTAKEFTYFIQGKVSVSEAIDAILDFNLYLDSIRKGGQS